jgi:hypothetical protein
MTLVLMTFVKIFVLMIFCSNGIFIMTFVLMTFVLMSFVLMSFVIMSFVLMEFVLLTFVQSNCSINIC